MLRVFASRTPNIGDLVQGNTQTSGGTGVRSLFSAEKKTCNISEKGQDRTKVTIDN